MSSPAAFVGKEGDPILRCNVEVRAACRTNPGVALEVFLLDRVAARLALSKQPFAEGLLLRGVDSGFGFRELGHAGS